jgi:transposase-like protein
VRIKHFEFPVGSEKLHELFKRTAHSLVESVSVLSLLNQAEQWQHIRTTNPIESTFGTVRLRTAKKRGCVSRAGMLVMVFKLMKTAEQKWRALKGHARLAKWSKA